jgi:uncharacterized membrane protein YphA (DoxX/SURF4 family)
MSPVNPIRGGRSLKISAVELLWILVTLAKNGFWGTLHEARPDVSMLLGLISLLLVGGGAWCLDAWLAERRGATRG